MLSLVAWFTGVDKFKDKLTLDDILPKRSTDDGIDFDGAIEGRKRVDDAEMARMNAEAQAKASRAMFAIKLRAIDRVRRRRNT